MPVTMADAARMVRGRSRDEIAAIVRGMPSDIVMTLVKDLGAAGSDEPAAAGLVDFATRVVPKFSVRPHIDYLASRVEAAVADVETGRNRQIMVHMPPRTGKTTTTTLVTPAWIMSQHPSWPIALTSYDGTLARSWGRQIRRWAEAGQLGPQVSIAPDAGAVGEWETTAGGRLMSMSVRESLTGRGVKCLIIDDPHKDFIEAHSKVMRDNIWDWWLSVARTRLEPPYLVIVTQTRWHTDDLSGRLLSAEHEGDPGDWEVISLPAIADQLGDVLGRAVGDPLLTPLLDETPKQAQARWADTKRAVGGYTWASMYQQRPAPASGAIFDTSWWRYWTRDPGKATDDGRVVLINPETDLRGGAWCDSWDATFKDSAQSDFVVGQRWVRHRANRYLIAQQRGRMSFTATLEAMRRWGRTGDEGASPCGAHVHVRLIEDKANGPAIISTLRDEIPGIKPVNPRTSKEARARAVTPEIESGNVYIPLPSDPGNGWVRDFLDELRDFPKGAHDDMTDSLTQALSYLRAPTGGRITVPRGSLPAGMARRPSRRR